MTSYIVKITATIRLRTTDNHHLTNKHHEIYTYVPAFSLDDARALVRGIESSNGSAMDDVRRSARIVIRTYIEQKLVYIPVESLERLANELSDLFTEYADERGLSNIARIDRT